jgi:hypothetical protein
MLGGSVLGGASAAIQELRTIENLIRSDIWSRWLALAQRRALVWWQQRRVPPGVAARFTMPGVSYYGFGSRLRKPYSIAPYYRVTGSLERAILARKPKTSRASGSVVSRIAFGGGSLNFMTTTGKPDMRPVTGWTRETRTLTESFNVSSYTRTTRGGASITVQAYSMTRQRTVGRSAPTRGGDTFATAFGRFTKDRPVLEARVAIELRNIVRKSAYTKKGDLRTALFAPLKETA